MKAYELLSDPAKWTTGKYARDGTGRSVRPDNPNATCWCIYGAILKCYPPSKRTPKIKRVAKKISEINPWTWRRGPLVTVWNDRYATYGAVVSVLKEADV